jgi:hypothetical protein
MSADRQKSLEFMTDAAEGSKTSDQDEPATKKKPSLGKCGLCGGLFGKAAMTRHIQSCNPQVPPAKASAKKPVECFHLVVEGGYRGMYWMHVSVAADEALSRLDGLLRLLWLECCGHLSAFSVNRIQYFSTPPDSGEKSMSSPLRKVLRVGDKFLYEYDFGSTTELRLKVAGLRESMDKVQILARNEPPEILCNYCDEGRPATQICSQCGWEEGSGWLCSKCAKNHECGEEMLLPAANSPRVGVCGYTG